MFSYLTELNENSKQRDGARIEKFVREHIICFVVLECIRYFTTYLLPITIISCRIIYGKKKR